MGGAGEVMEMERCVECSKEQTYNQCLTLFNDVTHISTQRRGRIPGMRTAYSGGMGDNLSKQTLKEYLNS